MKPRCQHGHAPSGILGTAFLPLSGGCCQPLAHSCSMLIPASVLTWNPSCTFLSSHRRLLFRSGHQSFWMRGPPSSSRPPLNSISSTKILLPNKVPLTDTRVRIPTYLLEGQKSARKYLIYTGRIEENIPSFRATKRQNQQLQWPFLLLPRPLRTPSVASEIRARLQSPGPAPTGAPGDTAHVGVCRPPGD